MLKRNKFLVIFLAITVLCASIGFAAVADTLLVNGRLALSFDNEVEDDPTVDAQIHFTKITNLKKVNGQHDAIDNENAAYVKFEDADSENNSKVAWNLTQVGNDTAAAPSKVAWLEAESWATQDDEEMDYDVLRFEIPDSVFTSADLVDIDSNPYGNILVLTAEIEYTGTDNDVNITAVTNVDPLLDGYVNITSTLDKNTLTKKGTGAGDVADTAQLTVTVMLTAIPNDIIANGEFSVTITAEKVVAETTETTAESNNA